MDRVGTTQRPRIPWGLAGMLAIVLAFEAFVARADPPFSGHAIDMWADARERSGSAEVRESAVLCFGDSQVQQGVLATVVGERLGAPAYSLAVPFGQPAAAEALLRRALGAGARPRAIVVGFFPTVLVAGFSHNARTWPELLGPAEAVDLAVTGGDVRVAGSTLVGLVLPSVKSRAEIRADLAAAIRGEVDGARAEVPERRRVRHAMRGSLALPRNPHFLDEPGPPGPANDAGLAWRPLPSNERYLRRFLALAASRGISVYWVAPPMSPNERAFRDRRGLNEGYDRYLRRLQGEFPNLVVLETRTMGFDRTAFGDNYHLDGPSAALLSRSVADAISAGPPGSRRVALVPVRDDARVAADGRGPAVR